MAEEKLATLINDAGIPEEAPEQEEKSSPSPAPQAPSPKDPDAERPEEEKPWTYIQIKPGETLESIAEKYERPPEEILEKNKIHPNDIRFGYWVFI